LGGREIKEESILSQVKVTLRNDDDSLMGIGIGGYVRKYFEEIVSEYETCLIMISGFSSE